MVGVWGAGLCKAEEAPSILLSFSVLLPCTGVQGWKNEDTLFDLDLEPFLRPLTSY